MTMTLLPPAPSSKDPTSFDDRADELLAVALPRFVEEANALALDVSAKQETASAAAVTATEQAGIATTKAGEAGDHADAALGSRVAAENNAGFAYEHMQNAEAAAIQASASKVAAAESAATIDPQALSSDYAGPDEPPVMWPLMTWADTATLTIKRRNDANSAWVIEGRLLVDNSSASVVSVIPAGNITQTNAQDALAGLDGRTTTIETSTWILAGVAGLVKPSYESPCLIKTGPGSLSVAAGTHVPIAGAWVSFLSETPVVMPALIPGTDYSVWVRPDGTAQAVADTYASPAVAPAPGAVRRGGFHHGLVAPGETVAGGQFSTGPITGSGGSMLWTPQDVDRIAGINEFTIWDSAWRCAGEQQGMFYCRESQSWQGIYLCGTAPHLNGVSAYNTDVASGTVLPFVPEEWGGDGVLKYTALNSWTAMEIVSAHRLRLFRSIEEFIPGAFGVTEGISLGGSAVTIPSTKREPRFTSRYGMEQATGHQWVIGAPTNAVGGSAYAGNGRGSWYGLYGMPIFGGDRDVAADSGSRSAAFSSALSVPSWNFSVRAAGDHLKLVGAAR